MFELKVITHFAAAHRLKMVAKKCENMHGHNWKIEVCVRSKKLNNAGVIIDFGEIKKCVAEITAKLDHCVLNELDCFRNKNPSSENIAFYIAGELQAVIENDDIKITSVTAWESEDACATYKLIP
ncbi:MAG: 6-carboxytetrahydropterin synthase QueD [Desulfobacterales bacterium]|uniref:6-carboxy-5,6,7,8-tetrahydropterin synthase n=1 Tax=Candidatus Desulfaltia bathyphila TaxID=2841697 RepID=A0A8J6T7I7_9BACT|nr:6-carboxytetrahydropterin synthase QueD [Candidatus Desulfaltia bathyphila]MBL7194981.1 6-carboxytetrahydropterin synthase QueD [Desulfobacterales bacterium]MBL7207702.1 6-carboxytetrahydropterin synthase QueD [Desulfobacterales bacterium]